MRGTTWAGSETFRRLAGPHRPLIAGLVASAAAGGTAEAALLVMVSRPALGVANGRREISLLAGRALPLSGAIAVMAALLVVRAVLSLTAAWASVTLSVRGTTVTRQRVADAFTAADWPTIAAMPAGRLQELVSSYASASTAVLGGFAGVLVNVLSLATLMAVSVLVNPLATVGLIVVMIVLSLVLSPIRNRIRSRAKLASSAQLELSAGVSELAGLGMEMHAFGVRGPFRERLGTLIRSMAKPWRRSLLMASVLAPAYTFVAYGAMIAALGLASLAARDNLDSVAAVLLVMMRSLSYGQALQGAYGGIAANAAYLDTLESAIDSMHAGAAPSGDRAVASHPRITFDHVSFAYDRDVVLHDVSFDIAPGELIGVVGPSGAGKSTMVQLLLGLRAPTSGEVRLGGVSMADLDHAAWTAHSAYVPQDARMMTGTVADNVRFFRQGISDEACRAALRAAHLDDELGGGDPLLHDLGHRGDKLSGGQRQRLSIARALAGSPELVVMDEPTSALDPASEAAIRRAVAELRGRVTVVIIAHRMSTLDACDRIMVLQDGVLRGIGEPAELAATNAFYREALELAGISAPAGG